MLRIHLLQKWYDLSDPAMQDVLIEVPMMRLFAGIELITDRISDETTILFMIYSEEISIASKLRRKLVISASTRETAKLLGASRHSKELRCRLIRPNSLINLKDGLTCHWMHTTGSQSEGDFNA
jgi:hypothetical protein